MSDIGANKFHKFQEGTVLILLILMLLLLLLIFFGSAAAATPTASPAIATTNRSPDVVTVVAINVDAAVLLLEKTCDVGRSPCLGVTICRYQEVSGFSVLARGRVHECESPDPSKDNVLCNLI